MTEQQSPVGSAGVMDLLRTRTRPLHDEAEHHEFQRSLAKGTLDQSEYVRFLCQMWHVHRSVERSTRRLLGERQELQPYFDHTDFLQDNIRGDALFLGGDVESAEPLGSTRALVESIDEDEITRPIAILGSFYVLEGSNNGARFIARNIAQAYGLTPGGDGLTYLLPYGDDQPKRWAAFRKGINGVEFSAEETEQIAVAAEGMFAGIRDISEELLAGG